MKLNNQEAKEKLTTRLHRVEGQIRGVESMLSEERDCQDILQQLSAIRSAVQSISRIFLQEYASVCLTEFDHEETSGSDQDLRMRREQLIKDMINLLDKAP
jgi:CsoR family transcriptional regulator, copper-sensing transcriptional repressor